MKKVKKLLIIMLTVIFVFTATSNFGLVFAQENSDIQGDTIEVEADDEVEVEVDDEDEAEVEDEVEVDDEDEAEVDDEDESAYRRHSRRLDYKRA